MRFLRQCGRAVSLPLAVVLLCLVTGSARADTGSAVVFTPPSSSPGMGDSQGSGNWNGTWRVSFSGFGEDETVELSFTAPDGTAAAVGDDIVFTASTQGDGTGVFNFVPGAWLQPLQEGTWTVTMQGVTSGRTASTTFTMTF